MNLEKLRKLAYDAFYKPEEDGTVFVKIPINANDGTLLVEQVYRYEQSTDDWHVLPIDNQTMMDLLDLAKKHNKECGK